MVSVCAALLLYLRADTITSGKALLSAFAQLTDEQTTSAFENVDQTLQAVEAAISTATEAGTASEDTMQVMLYALVANRPYLKVIRVIDERGRTVYGSDTGNVGVDMSGREFFGFHRDSRGAKFRINTPIRGLAGEWVIPVSRERLRADGTFAGVIYAGLDPHFFDQVWTLDTKIPGLSTALIRQDGMLLTRSPFIETAIGVLIAAAPDFYNIRTGAHAGTYEATSVFDGKQRLLAYRLLKAYPSLVVVIGQPMDQVLAAWWRLAGMAAFGCAIAAAALGGLAVWRIRDGKARRATEDRYRVFFDANPYPMIALDRVTGRIVAVNDSAVEDYGWSREEALTMTANDLYAPSDLPLAKSLRSAGALERARGLKGLHLRKKDGTVVDVELTQRPIELDGRSAFLATAIDVTERDRAERARLATEAQLRQAQKMEAVGQLTGGIAHDFNNILMVVMANVDALLDEHLDAALTRRVEDIDKAVERATGLTRQLLAFSRKQALRPQQTDLNELVVDTGKLLHRALGAQIVIETALANGLCVAHVDRGQLETALVNLCVNARDAMPEGGRLMIETRNVMLDEAYVAQNPGATAGANAMLSVTDTGIGIPPDILARVFEPFFTTKEVGKGTGLGLSMVYGFIKQSDGHIAISSEVGRGTSIKLYLPCSGGAVEELVVRGRTGAGGHERILIVEDEASVRAIVVEQLESLGYAVSEAASGEAGIAVLEAAAIPFELMLTDIVMPGRLNGKLLAAEVARRWPRTKIVFMSGFTEISGAQQGQLGDDATLLNKPVRKADLARTIRHKLDEVGAPGGTPVQAA